MWPIVTPPTEAQVKYATDINRVLCLGADLDGMDKWQMRDFISANVDAFKREYARRRAVDRKIAREWRRNRPSSRFYTDSDFGCGGDDPICTCFDMGIYPWGNS